MKRRELLKQFSAVAFMPFLGCGCKTLQGDADPIAVRAEQTLSIALVSVDQALRFEFENRNSQDFPEWVTGVAHSIRKDAAKAFMSADRVRVAYKQGGADANTLLKAINVVDALVGEIKWWVPHQFAESNVTGSEVDLLLSEALVVKSNTSANWIAAVPMFIDLGRTIYSLALEVKDSLGKDRAWTPTQDAEFRAKLLKTITQEHWKA